MTVPNAVSQTAKPNVESTTETGAMPRKFIKKPVYDFSKYKGKVVTVFLVNEMVVTGLLYSFDHNQSVILKDPRLKSVKWEFHESLICLGNMISGIAPGVVKEVSR